MNRTRESKYSSVRFFDNPILNKLCHTNIVSLSIVFIPVALYFIYLSIRHHPPVIVIFGMLLGLFIWSFVEYFTHRFLFHFKFTNERIKYLHSIFHLAHHKYTQDSSKYQTLLVLSIPGSIAFYYLFMFLFGSVGSTVMAGFIIGNIIYEYTHYSTHKFKMQTKIGKFLKQHHMHHHYFDDKKNFGVTSLLWDWVFNTHTKKTNKQ